MAVAGGVSDGVFLCCSFFPLDVLDEIWDVTESVSEGFLTYFLLCQNQSHRAIHKGLGSIRDVLAPCQKLVVLKLSCRHFG